MVASAYSDEIRPAVALIVDRLQADIGAINARIQRRILADVGELSADPQLSGLLRSSVAGNVETVLAVIRHGIEMERVEAPTAALEYARRVAQHAIPVSALVRAYRLGQQEMLERILREIRQIDVEPDLRLAAYDAISRISFGYIDWISEQVSDAYEAERERWLEHRNSMRTVRVQELLDNDDDVDVDAASAAMGYPLRGRHLALILWATEGDSRGGGLLELERFSRAAAEALKLRRSVLFVAQDRLSGSVWLPLDSAATEPNRTIRQLVERSEPGIGVAVGTVDNGLSGFRRSHRRAHDARTVAAAAVPPSRFVDSSDHGVAVAALLARNLTDTRRWVHDTLGELAGASPNDERLRETLRVFLREGSSYTAAAEHLLLHPNSVRYRVARAVQRRGRPIGADRLDVEVALLACGVFARAVLKS